MNMNVLQVTYLAVLSMVLIMKDFNDSIWH